MPDFYSFCNNNNNNKIDCSVRNDEVTAQELQKIQGKNDWRDGSSNVSRKQILTMPLNTAAERDVQRQCVPQRAAVTGKARSPMVERRVRGTTIDDVDAERRRWRASSADDWWSSSARYGGAVWYRHLYTRTASLNLMRSGTFSQCSCVGSGVMRSYLDAENTSRAAEFNTDCIRLVRWDGMPVSVALA